MAAVSAVPEPTKIAILPNYELFEARTICNQTLNGHTESIYPQAGISDNVTGPITFTIKGTSDFIDFNKTFLYIRGKFKGSVKDPADGTKTIDIMDNSNPHFSYVNLFPHALFKSVGASINTTSIASNTPNYQYIADFQTRLNSNKATLDTYMRTAGWCKDEGEVDSIDPAKNDAHRIRFDRITAKKELFFTIDLATPLLQLNKFLISECDVEIMLRKNDNPKFYMMHDAAGHIDFEITEAILKVRKVTPTPEVISAVQQYLTDVKPLTYVLDDPRIIITSVQKGETFIHREYATLGHHPKRILVAMVETEAYNGHPEKNPFNYQHFNVGKITLTKNGLEYPTPPITPDFENGNYVEAYRHFLSSIQADKSPFVPDITPEEFANGSFLISWDMSPDQYGGDDPQMLVNRTANIKLSIEFRRPLPKPITLIFYYQLESRLTINQFRQITHEVIS